MAPNEKAIRKWVADHRPDLQSQIDSLVESQAAFAIMSMAFEAGRDFQRANPEKCLGYLTEPTESYNWNYY